MSTAPVKTSADKGAATAKKTWLARKFMPTVDKDSALLPPDSWIKKTAWSLFKESKPLKKNLALTGALITGGLAALVLGAYGVAALLPAALAVTGVATAALALGGLCGMGAKRQIDQLKDKIWPDLRNSFGRKYLEYKMEELKSAWKKRAEEKKKARGDAAMPKDTAKNPDSAPAQPPQERAAEKKPEEKKSLGSSFGAWAEKRAQALRDKRKQSIKPPDAPGTPVP